jgi:transposase-like protein
MRSYHRLAPSDEDLIIRLDREEMERLVEQELHRSAMEVGLVVISELLENDVRVICGERRRRTDQRRAYRYGKQPGYVIMSGHKVGMNRPRLRSLDKRKEVELPLYRRLQRQNVIGEHVMRRLMRGVSCRNYRSVIEAVAESAGVSRSSVSRLFVAASESKLRQLLQRRFNGVRFMAIFIDGVQFKRQTLVVAIGVNTEGRKVVLSIRQGATENARVCSDLLEELRDRGVSTDVPTLFVLDGSKALRAAVGRVWGELAVIQRCRVHKLRNLEAYANEQLWPQVRDRVRAAYAETNYHKAKRSLLLTARWLERIAPAAAASLYEGLEETLTVTRLNLPLKLRKTFSSTNLVESALSRVRMLTSRVKRWRNRMCLRWTATALLHAEETFDRINGFLDMPSLITALGGLDGSFQVRTA